LIPSTFSHRWRAALTGLTALALAGLALPASAAIPATERAVLEAIYNDTGGASWTNSTGWMGTAGTECSWYRVTCNGSGDHVTGINLSNNNLSGTLPDLSALTALEVFNVGRNGLTDSLPTLPLSIKDFQAQTNQLSGQIPNLSTLAALEHFDVTGNSLDGSPPALPSAIKKFRARANQLDGQIPDLSALAALEFFDVAENHLNGSLPALPTSIQEFWAQDNQLSGQILDLSTLTALEYFIVHRNDLSGPIPDLSTLVSLISINVSSNDLSGPLPALSPSITHFYAYNNDLTGPIPDLTTSNLKVFRVHNNQLSGAPASVLPASIDYATVCPNYLELSDDPAINAAWEAATGNQPWNEGCTSAPPAPADATAIPTLSGWTLALLSLLLGGIAIWPRQNAG